MEKTERGIDFVGRIGRWWVIFGYIEFGVFVDYSSEMSNICFRKGGEMSTRYIFMSYQYPNGKKID